MWYVLEFHANERTFYERFFAKSTEKVLAYIYAIVESACNNVTKGYIIERSRSEYSDEEFDNVIFEHMARG